MSRVVGTTCKGWNPGLEAIRSFTTSFTTRKGPEMEEGTHWPIKGRETEGGGGGEGGKDALEERIEDDAVLVLLEQSNEEEVDPHREEGKQPDLGVPIQ